MNLWIYNEIKSFQYRVNMGGFELFFVGGVILYIFLWFGAFFEGFVFWVIQMKLWANNNPLLFIRKS